MAHGALRHKIKALLEKNMSERKFKLPDYTYRAYLIRVIDGDTIDVDLDLGCHIYIRKRLRFLDFDAEEVRGGTDESKRRGRECATALGLMLTKGKLYVQTEMDAEGKYGRLLARLFTVDDNTNVVIDVIAILKARGFEKIRS